MMKNRNVKLNIFVGMFFTLALASTAWAANCGGAIPCECGDTVTADRTLVDGVDPIVGDKCPDDGLVMNTDGVTLDLGGNKIVGQGGGSGILVDDTDNVVEDITIRKGRIQKFNRGIDSTTKKMNNSTVDKIKVRDNKEDGMKLNGDDNEITNNKMEKNGRHGINLDGDDNELSKNKATNNDLDGIKVDGTGNELKKNKAKKNGRNGIKVTGGGNIDGGGNKGKKNGNKDCEIDNVTCS